MKRMLVVVLWMSALSCALVQAESCLTAEKIARLDGQYETALQLGDVTFLDKLLAPDFMWVHNLASLKESKAQLLVRIPKPEERTKERRSHDITLQRLGNTVVLQGLSSVDKWNPDGKTFRTSRYQFMRTYVEDKGECKLLAVQTMKVWSSEGD